MSSTAAEEEAVDICRDLIRLDTTNPTSNERAAAEHVAALLAEVGIDSKLVESAPGRASVVARVEGVDQARPALLIHGHLDVVPAEPADWAVHPFSGEIRDGCVWGRGAVDMKDMDAMTLAVIRDRARSGRRPPRDVVLAFVADEEAGGSYGARFLVEEHAEFFEGVSEAIGEVGGFSFSVGGRRLYPIETAEKGMAWVEYVAEGTAGHGSMLAQDNAVVKLAEAVARIGAHRFARRLHPTVEAFLRAVAEACGETFDPANLDPLLRRLGTAGPMVEATLRHTANPTMLAAGYKVNVLPQSARASVDGRFLPDAEEEFLAELDAVAGSQVRRSFIHRDNSYATSFDGPLVQAMIDAVTGEDPEGIPVPYCLSGGTDAKSFSRLGIRCFGFSPLRLPEGLNFFGMFHGVDERVPLDALAFGTRVLDRFLDAC